MGAWMSRVWFLMFPAQEYKLVVVGLDNAGKTTTLYKLHLGEAVTAAPTIGSNVEEIVFKNLRFEVSPAPQPPGLQSASLFYSGLAVLRPVGRGFRDLCSAVAAEPSAPEAPPRAAAMACSSGMLKI